MSLCLQIVLKFYAGTKLETVSDECFSYIDSACRRKIAINRVARFDTCTCLSMDELLFDVSNSYIFCEAEAILRDDHTISNPSHIVRLRNFQDFLEEIFRSKIVSQMKVYMYDDGEPIEDFEEIQCSLSNFAKTFKEVLYQKISYAYKCKFAK